MWERRAPKARESRRRGAIADGVGCGEKFSSQNGVFWCNMKQWLFYTPLVWREAASFGGDIGVQGRVPGQGLWGEAPQKLKAFCFTIFSEACAEIKRFERLMHDGSKCAESRKDVPFGG